MKTLTKIIYPALALGAVAFLILMPQVQAVSPPPDGGYPHQNTAEGTDALFSLDIDSLGGNTAVGSTALYGDTTGIQNTGVGSNALYNNKTGNDNTGRRRFRALPNQRR